jgi:hypothetical protein
VEKKKIRILRIDSPKNRFLVDNYPEVGNTIDIVICENNFTGKNDNSGVSFWAISYPGIVDVFRSRKEVMSSKGFDLNGYVHFVNKYSGIQINERILNIRQAVRMIKEMFPESDLEIFPKV